MSAKKIDVWGKVKTAVKKASTNSLVQGLVKSIPGVGNMLSTGLSAVGSAIKDKAKAVSSRVDSVVSSVKSSVGLRLSKKEEYNAVLKTRK